MAKGSVTIALRRSATGAIVALLTVEHTYTDISQAQDAARICMSSGYKPPKIF